MGREDLVYGAIFCRAPARTSPRFPETSAAIFASTLWLPRDDESPALTRNLFALTAPDYETPGFYKYFVLHFGASLKCVADDWDIWLDKLESFLERLPWHSAHLHLLLEVPPKNLAERSFDYRWRVPRHGEPSRRESWSFEGGPKEFGDVPARCRAEVTRLEKLLEDSPDDIDALRRMISACARLRRHEEAFTYWERLLDLDQDVAEQVPHEWLAPWAGRRQDSWGESDP